jgi:hypothetical protein
MAQQKAKVTAPPEKVKVPVQGKDTPGVEVDIKSSVEHWNEYTLSDGTKLKVKIVLTRVVRTEKFKPDGEPVYFFEVANVGAATVPNKLKKKK